jgi:2-keto-4-pentenoate hydratase/2-oxohepta-3-ene-1,7-dioic acid hydratase in catechol pathway
MKLMRIGAIGAERPVLLHNERYLDLSSVAPDINAQFWVDGSLERVRTALVNDALPSLDVAGLRIGAPIAKPGVVVCIGMNYAAHAAETGAQLPEHLVMFYKAPNTVVGPEDDILLPRGSVKTDWEIELGVVIGRRARYLDSPADALDYVAGYCISNDVSERAFQLEISTADMAINVASIIWQLSQVTVLEPGDLINTGTPQGVAVSGKFPYLKAGDTIEMEIENLGRQRQSVRQAARDE